MIDYVLDERFEQSHTLSFGIPASDPKAQTLVADYVLDVSGDKYYITSVIGDRQDEKAMLYVEAEANWMRLADIKRVGTFALTKVTAQEGMVWILGETGWTANMSNAPGIDFSIEAQDATVLDLLWQWAQITNCELRFNSSSKTIDLLTMVGSNRGISFRYGKNLKSIKKTVVPPQATRIFPFGRTDIDVSSLTSGGVGFIEDYSYYMGQGLTLDEARTLYRKDEIFQDDTFIDAGALYAAAQTRLSILAQPMVTYECKVADLSTITGYDETYFSTGDTVYVYDEILKLNLQARVTRRQIYPYEPQRNEVELTFGKIILPNGTAKSSRTNSTLEWELFESQNRKNIRKVRNGSTILHRMLLTTVALAEWTVNYKLSAVGVGTGTVTVQAVNDTTAEVLWPAKTFDITPGCSIEWDFSYGEKEVTADKHIMVIRAVSSGAGVGIDIAQRQSAFWILARGTTRSNLTLPNIARFNYVGNGVQHWTVPDDVTEVLIECQGSAGEQRPRNSVAGAGYGGKVTASFNVLGGTTYDIRVGGGDQAMIDGGFGSTAFGSEPTNGGGSSNIRPSGGSLSSALIVAAGGGGSGDGFGANIVYGGHGGFYTGQEPGYGSVSARNANMAATQDAPGTGGYSGNYGSPFGWPKTGDDGDTTQLGYGGNSNGSGSYFAFPGGGGGGGWHGGGGAGGGGASGFYSGGGGGGSGMMQGGWDLDFEDAYNSADGFVIISWKTPDDTTT